MLRHSVIGPQEGGYYAVAYGGPHSREKTVVCDQLSKTAAEGEAQRLNSQQATQERTLQEERRLCGMRGAR